MKKLILILSLVFLFSSCNEERLYCGEITDLYLAGSGSKGREEPHVVFFSDSLQRNIHIQPSWNTYHNLKLKQTVCFKLNEFDLRR